MINLLDLKDYDDYTYTHSMNVSILAIMLAKKLNYNPNNLRAIGTAGLIHDIGKTMIPREIINKNAALNEQEFELMKRHPVFGYEIVKSSSSYSTAIQKMVLLHHEKISGKGYPFGLHGEQIDDLTQILGISDVFDALTSARSYKAAFPFWFALTEIRRESGSSYSPRLAKTFVNEMPSQLTESEIFKKGTFTVLNTGEIAEVVDYNFPQTLSPSINIYINAKKEKVHFPISINLEYDDTRWISQVIENPQMIEKLTEIKSSFPSNKTNIKEAQINEDLITANKGDLTV
jgi:putative nucleotidyltransferase with HDIG domain